MFETKLLDLKINKAKKQGDIIDSQIFLEQETSISLTYKSLDKKLFSRLFQLLIIVAFLLLTFRLAVIQVYTAPVWQEWASRSSNQVVHIIPPRGRILDRYGKTLVDSQVSFAVVTTLKTIQNQDKKDLIKMRLDLSEKDIESAVNAGYGGFIKLKKDLKGDEMLKVADLTSDIEVELIPEYSRSYLDKTQPEQVSKLNSLSAIVGYTGLADQKQSQNLDKEIYKPETRIGVTGLEKTYENTLQGFPGRIERRTVIKNTQTQDRLVVDPIQGQDLTTTIDLDLQLKIYDLTKAEFSKDQITSGSVIVMNAKNGEIRTMLNFPDYDPSAFEDKSQQFKLGQYFRDELRPLFNRSTRGQYPPGSSIKPFVGAVAMQNNIISPDDEILDNGVLQVRSKTVDGRIDQYINYKSINLGVLNLSQAIAKSSDVFFYYLVGGDPETGKIPYLNDSNRQNPLGVIELDIGLRQFFGFGERTGVDLDLENKGILPTPEYKVSRGFGNWFLGDDYQTSIGQGFFLSTPLQLARATAVLANGGNLVTPHFASNQNNQQRQSGLNNQVLDYIKRAMRAVVLEGTAKRLQDNRSSIAAKTGSAQFDPSKPLNVYGWVVSYNESQEVIDEQLVVIVLTEDISKTAEFITVPIANKIWQEIEKHYESK